VRPLRENRPLRVIVTVAWLAAVVLAVLVLTDVIRVGGL
jgi:hypothetical protein